MDSLSDRRAEKFVDLRPTLAGTWVAFVWRWGGHIDGSAQPYKTLDEWYGNEISVRVGIEENYPGIQYAPVPEYLNGMLLP